MKVLGIDPSVSATGLVLLQENGKKPPIVLLEDEVKFPKLAGMERLQSIAQAVMGCIHEHKPDKIVIEGYSLNMKNASSVVPLVELGGLLRFLMYMDGLKWYAPRATELKKFVTGKGTSEKSIVMMNILKRWGHESKTNNTADAYGLAALGLAIANRLSDCTMDMKKVALAIEELHQ